MRMNRLIIVRCRNNCQILSEVRIRHHFFIQHQTMYNIGAYIPDISHNEPEK